VAARVAAEAVADANFLGATIKAGAYTRPLFQLNLSRF
jgi:hypothetical protein